jgi:serine/threonine protein kinase
VSKTKTAKATATLHETCSVCGLPVGKSSTSLTTWIFGRSTCGCATTPGAEKDETADRSLSTESPLPAASSFYETICEVGRGGMGAVYKVKDVRTGKFFAMKVLHSEFALDKDAVKRFQAEIEATRLLSHPNMANVYDSGTNDDGCPFFLMDFIDGESLADLLRREKALPLQRALNIFVQLCDVLGYAHENKLIHRDLKPSNILVHTSADGLDLVKVVDFGIAKILPMQDAETLSLTRTAEIFGSPQYMSPEQCKGDRVEARSDIYALGCVLFETLTGAPPFQCENAVKVLLSQIYDDLPSMRSPLDSRKLPQHVQDVLTACLAKKPDARYASMKELSVDLQKLIEGKEPAASRKLNTPARKRMLKITLFKYSPLLLIALTALLLYLNQSETAVFLQEMKHIKDDSVTKSLIEKSDAENKPFVVVTRGTLTREPDKVQPAEREAINLFINSHRPRHAVACYRTLIASQLKSGNEAAALESLKELEKLFPIAVNAPPEKGRRLIGWFYMPAPSAVVTVSYLASELAGHKMFDSAKQLLSQEIELLGNRPSEHDELIKAKVQYIEVCYLCGDIDTARAKTIDVLHKNVGDYNYTVYGLAETALKHGDYQNAERVYKFFQHGYSSSAQLGIACCAIAEGRSDAATLCENFVHNDFLDLSTMRQDECSDMVNHLLKMNRSDLAENLLKGLATAEAKVDPSKTGYRHLYEDFLANKSRAWLLPVVDQN